MTNASLSLAVLVGSVSRLAGGLFNSVRRNSIMLTEAGCDVTVYSLADAHCHEDALDWQPLSPKIFSTRGPRALGYAPALSAAVADGHHDVLHLHGLWQHLSLQALKWRKDTSGPLMISPRGMLDAWALGYSGWKKRMARALFEGNNLRGAACLHALNAAEAEAMRIFGLTNPIAIIPNGIDIPQPGETTQRPEWLPDDDRKVLLYIGRLHPKKGLSELLVAWALLKRRAPNVALRWRLVVAGWDDAGGATDLELNVASLNLADDIVFTGPLYGEAKAAALAKANAYILPSFSEGLPMAVLEAWAYGLPVFMTAACNLPEGFATGAAVEILNDPAVLAAVLGEHLPDPRLEELGQRGRNLVADRYCWGPIAKAHIRVYHWMLHGGEPPDCVQLS